MPIIVEEEIQIIGPISLMNVAQEIIGPYRFGGIDF